MSMLLEIDYTKPVESIADKFSFGGQMVLIGMSVVFAVLMILWGSLELFHLIVTKVPELIEKKKQVSVPVSSENEINAPVAANEVSGNDDENELVAVFAAAIAAASAENPNGSFKVVSFRRV